MKPTKQLVERVADACRLARFRYIGFDKHRDAQWNKISNSTRTDWRIVARAAIREAGRKGK